MLGHVVAGKWQNIDGSLIVPGDLVLLAAGSAVPADSYVNEHEIEVLLAQGGGGVGRTATSRASVRLACGSRPLGRGCLRRR